MLPSGYQPEDPTQYVPAADVHYAELSFAGHQALQAHPHPHASMVKAVQQQSVEYAKIEFNKTQRVNLIGGSPKFESTV